MQFKQPKIIAHRGGRTWAPENTMAAFAKSVAAGIDGIELDVQRCASGELVVIHDCDVTHTTSGAGLIKDLTLAQLKSFSAGAWFGSQFAGETIPLLEDVLRLVNGKLLINIEVKNVPHDYPGIDDDLLKLLSGYGHRDQLIISAFDHDVLRRIHGKAADLRLAVLANALPLDLPDYAKRCGATVWHPFFNTTRADSVAAAHAAGLEVNIWTCNSQSEWKTCIDMGVDGIVTDDPVGLKQYLAFLQAS